MAKTKKENINAYKFSPMGVIPEDWDVLSLCELGEFKNGINKFTGMEFYDRSNSTGGNYSVRLFLKIGRKRKTW